MIQQPRIPPTGQRQAIEVHIKWREVLDYKRELLRMLSIGTGWGVDKLDFVSQFEQCAGAHERAHTHAQTPTYVQADMQTCADPYMCRDTGMQTCTCTATRVH